MDGHLDQLSSSWAATPLFAGSASKACAPVAGLEFLSCTNLGFVARYENTIQDCRIVATVTELRAVLPKVRQGSRRDTWGETGFAGLLGSGSMECLD